MSSNLPPGARLGRYEIKSLLGAGGMGEVYLAQDTKLDRRVALKILPAEVAAHPDRMKRFVQEAKTASALNHPNIITIHEVDHSDSVHFIATEFIDGETLRQHMRHAPMRLGEAIDVAIHSASALSAAHTAGIVHRDIKPENIMLRRDSIVKVLDFGLAKLTERLPLDSVDTEAPTRIGVHTDPGMVMGTAIYMSPEQARGLQVDARTDIFSLGVLIYEMVTGRLPFDGSNTNEILASILSDKEPAPLARYAREVPSEFERIVAKALRKNRDERYQTIKDLLLDLQTLKQELEFERKLERSVPPKSESTAEVPEAAIKTVAESARSTVSGRWPSALFNRQSVIIVVAALLIVALATAAYFRFTHGSGDAINSLAVLPFANVSGNPDADYLYDGITDNIINRLSQLPNLKVMSHVSVFRYKGKDADAQAVGRELQVGAVLTGRIVEHGDALTITVELVDARDNSHIWGEQYDGKLSDVIAVQRELPRDIAEKLRPTLSGEQKERLTKGYTNNSEAYQLYLKGRYSWEKWTQDGSKQAVVYFKQAIEKDPNYALAYSGLADAYMFGTGSGGGLPRDEAVKEARTAVTKALEIDRNLGEAHASFADILFYEDWNFAAAEKEFKYAIQLSPSYAEAHHLYSHFLLAMGRTDESLAESLRFLELEPLAPAPNLHLGYQYLYSRQYDLAIKQHQKTLEMDPNYARAHEQLADTYFQKGMFDEAVAEYLKVRTLNRASPEDLAGLKESYATAGIKGFLRKQIDLATANPVKGASYPFYLALLYSRLGEKDKAFEWLDKAYAAHTFSLVHVREEVGFDNVRSDARFADLVRRVGLPQ